MAGPWYTSSEAMQEVADILKKDVGELEEYWVRQCAKAAAAAYRDLSGILLSKNYTPQQLDLWDFRNSYSADQALFWLFTKTSLGLDMDDKEVIKLDHREELRESATIVISGEAVKPEGAAGGGGVGGGMISETGFRITGETEF